MKLFRLGNKRKVSLKFMHSSDGTSTFKRLSKRDRGRWARWDSRHSRGMYNFKD